MKQDTASIPCAEDRGPPSWRQKTKEIGPGPKDLNPWADIYIRVSFKTPVLKETRSLQNNGARRDFPQTSRRTVFYLP
jgi:hypothetical protein